MTERIGQRFGNYRLLRALGQGSFAEVYLGEHVHLQSFAAIKILYTQLTSDLQENFLYEAQVLAQLSHPHIIRILDFGIEADGTPYLIMEHAPHGALRQHYHSKLPLPTVVEYIKQITDGLSYAHNKKLIHRDLKPDNILIGQQGELLISDFGVALIARTTRSSHDAEDKFAGTAAYMSPEQLRGLPQFASDQYALGIMTYEWLCGRRPFQGGLIELYNYHLSTLPSPLRQHTPELPREVERVVLRALEKEPARRFPDVKAFAIALEQAQFVSQQAGNVQSDAPSNLELSQVSPMPSLSGPTIPSPTEPQPVSASPDDFFTPVSSSAYNNDPTLPASQAASDLNVPLSDPDRTTPVVNQPPKHLSQTRPRKFPTSKALLLVGLILLLILSTAFTVIHSHAGNTTSISTTPSRTIPTTKPTANNTVPALHLTPTSVTRPCLTSSVSSNPVYQSNGHAYSNGGTYHSASADCKGRVYFAFTSAPPVVNTQVRLCIADGPCGNWVQYKAVKSKLLIMQNLPVGTSFHLQFQGYGASDSYQVKGKLYY